jgi:hypothetical protein
MPNDPRKPQNPGLIIGASLVAFLVGVAAIVLVLFLASAVTGFADGDPPSDYLLVNQVYLPINQPSAESGERLQALVAAANDDGYTIRVAIIQSKQDLGSIPQLMGKPQTYAKFLGAEVGFGYTGRILTVMSNGYGISVNGGEHEPGGYEQLKGVPLPAGSSPDQLTDAASAAVRKLAASNGHPLPLNPSLGGSQSFFAAHKVLVIAAVVLIVLALAAAGVSIRRRGNRQRGHDE